MSGELLRKRPAKSQRSSVRQNLATKVMSAMHLSKLSLHKSKLKKLSRGKLIAATESTKGILSH